MSKGGGNARDEREREGMSEGGGEMRSESVPADAHVGPQLQRGAVAILLFVPPTLTPLIQFC